MRDLVQPRSRARDLRRAMRLLVGGGADFLRELIDLSDHVRNLAQRRVQFLSQIQSFIHDGRALLHVIDSFARFLLYAFD